MARVAPMLVEHVYLRRVRRDLQRMARRRGATKEIRRAIESLPALHEHCRQRALQREER